MICYLHLTPKQFPCRMPYQCITRQESRICYVLPDCVTSAGLRFDWIIICPPLGLYLHTNQRKCKVNIWISQNTRGQHITILQQDNSNFGRETGWQKLAAFRRRQNCPQKFSSGAYLLFLPQIQIQFSNMCHVIMHFLPTKHCF